MADQDKAAPQTVSKKEIEDNKLNGILCYLGILIIVPLVDEKAKKSPYVKFHINQGLLLILTSIILIPVYAILTPIIIIGWLVGIAIWITMVVIWITGLMSAVNGQMKRLPIIGNYDIFK